MMQFLESKNIKSNTELNTQRFAVRNEKLWNKLRSLKPHLPSQRMVRGLKSSKVNSKNYKNKGIETTCNIMESQSTKEVQSNIDRLHGCM